VNVYFGAVVPHDDKPSKPQVMPRTAMNRAVEALRHKADNESGLSYGDTKFDKESTQAWKDANKIDKWLKANKYKHES